MTHWINAVAIMATIGSRWKIYDAPPPFPFVFPRVITLGGWLAGAPLWHFAAIRARRSPACRAQSGLGASGLGAVPHGNASDAVLSTERGLPSMPDETLPPRLRVRAPASDARASKDLARAWLYL